MFLKSSGSEKPADALQALAEQLALRLRWVLARPVPFPTGTACRPGRIDIVSTAPADAAAKSIYPAQPVFPLPGHSPLASPSTARCRTYGDIQGGVVAVAKPQNILKINWLRCFQKQSIECV